MKAGKIKSLFMFIIGCFYAVCAYSATSLFSDYGQIQNVQNYSTNPFWSPNAPYNQKIPQPVYVQGNAVTTDECIRVIQSAVAFQCAARDNCRNTQLTDIRPAIIVQLSNLPGKAYGTACAGYLDSVFESYVAQYGNNAPTRQVAFPDSTIPNPSINNNSNTIQIKNPYEIKTPQWQQEINERSRELQELQSENGAGNYGLSATAFPTTYNDLSFTNRMANEAAGYAPYKDKSAYKTIEVKNAKEWCAGHDGPECDEYKCSIGGPNENETGCILYRCAKPDYSKSHQEECICAKKGNNSYECMKMKCDKSTSAECHKWKCANDQDYAAQTNNGCQTQPKNENKKGNKGEQQQKDKKQKTAAESQNETAVELQNDMLCAELTDRSQCCAETNTGCIKELCDGNTEFKKNHNEICKDSASTETQNEEDSETKCETFMLRSEKLNKQTLDSIFKDISVAYIDVAMKLSYVLICNTAGIDLTLERIQNINSDKQDYSGQGFDYFDDFIIVGSSYDDKVRFNDFTHPQYLSDTADKLNILHALCNIANGKISDDSRNTCENISYPKNFKLVIDYIFDDTRYKNLKGIKPTVTCSTSSCELGLR